MAGPRRCGGNVIELHSVASASTVVHAILDSTALSVPPSVRLSYHRRYPPLPLFTELEGLGWRLPAVDLDALEVPATDADIGRVDDVVLREGPWSPGEAGRIGHLTIATLRRHSVRVHATPNYERLLFPAQVLPGEAGVANAVADVVHVPHTLVVELRERSVAEDCSYRTFGVRTTSAAKPLVWAERLRPVGASERRAQLRLVEGSVFAWRVDARSSVPQPDSGDETSLHLVVDDARRSLELLSTLRASMGDRVASFALRPMSGAPLGTREALLIVGIVASDRFERIADLLVEREPRLLIRS